MIKKLSLKNFTVFEQADIEFSPGLNVIIGENGTGKTHLLKLGYLFSTAWKLTKHGTNKKLVSKEQIERHFSEGIRGIFKPDKVGSLTSNESDGKTTIACLIFDGELNSKHHDGTSKAFDNSEYIQLDFSFSNRSKENIVYQKQTIPLIFNQFFNKSVFLPSKEILSFFDGFLALSVKREIQFDATYSDLALNLATPKLKTVPPFVQHALSDLIDDVCGTLELEGGKFYLVSESENRQEITLVAEGIRKLATLMHLIENGSLEQGDTLFWDEPESNLNPKLIKDVAAALLFLCKNDIQVVIATHSYFLVKELDLLIRSAKPATNIRYFGLQKSKQVVIVEQGNTIQETGYALNSSIHNM